LVPVWSQGRAHNPAMDWGLCSGSWPHVAGDVTRDTFL